MFCLCIPVQSGFISGKTLYRFFHKQSEHHELQEDLARFRGTSCRPAFCACQPARRCLTDRLERNISGYPPSTNLGYVDFHFHFLISRRGNKFESLCRNISLRLRLRPIYLSHVPVERSSLGPCTPGIAARGQLSSWVGPDCSGRGWEGGKLGWQFEV